MSTEPEEKKTFALATQLNDEASTIPLTITNEDDAFVATDMLLKIRKTYNELEAKRLERTGPANETIKLINDDYKSFLKPLKVAEEKVSVALENYVGQRTVEDTLKLENLRKETGDTSLMIPIGLKALPSQLGDVRFRTKLVAKVVDASQVPAIFLTVDLKAIQAAVDENDGNIDIPGVELVQTTSSSIYLK